jgi:predicted lipoprotein with Yx(FWY)xxD motif
MPRAARLTALMVALAPALAVACGGSSAPKPDRRAAAGPPASVRVARSRLGRILVDARGHTLYLFTQDRRGRSRCYGECARVWHAAIVGGRAVAGAGLTAKLGTVRRRDHSSQLVYNGHPLYTLVADRRPGQINGEGFLGSWFVVSPAGRQIGHAKGGGY